MEKLRKAYLQALYNSHSEETDLLVTNSFKFSLTAVIEDLEKDVVFYTEHAEGKYDLEMQDPTVYAERTGARNYAEDRLKWLKEARSSLDGGGTSITNSTPE